VYWDKLGSFRKISKKGACTWTCLLAKTFLYSFFIDFLLELLMAKHFRPESDFGNWESSIVVCVHGSEPGWKEEPQIASISPPPGCEASHQGPSTRQPHVGLENNHHSCLPLSWWMWQSWAHHQWPHVGGWKKKGYFVYRQQQRNSRRAMATEEPPETTTASAAALSYRLSHR